MLKAVPVEIHLPQDDEACSICVFNYDVDKYKPKMVCSNSHIVCKQCLWTMFIDPEIEFKCPYCKQTIEYMRQCILPSKFSDGQSENKVERPLEKPIEKDFEEKCRIQEKERRLNKPAEIELNGEIVEKVDCGKKTVVSSAGQNKTEKILSSTVGQVRSGGTGKSISFVRKNQVRVLNQEPKVEQRQYSRSSENHEYCK